MSSSFPAARFPAIPFRKDRADSDPLLQQTAIREDGPTDEALLSRMREADKEALGLLFDRYARLAYSIGKRILRDPAEAEDFVQELFLHLFRKAHLFDNSKGPARGWIVQTCYYRALHRRARLTKRPHYGSRELEELEDRDITAAPLPGYDQSGEGLFGRVRWRELMACLSDDQRETLRLHFYAGYSFEEISEIRNLTVGAVRHHFYRGLDRLRKHIFASELRDR
jgi:RNA polymerase sigma-70 factor, ECF subfamily